MITIYTEIMVFILGMCLGSFMNVCIYRLPRSTSVLNPRRSFCPNCETSIPFYDNIPMISYVLLRGRCRTCRESISPRYPIIEMITGFFALCTVLKFDLTLVALIYFLFIAVLIGKYLYSSKSEIMSMILSCVVREPATISISNISGSEIIQRTWLTFNSALMCLSSNGSKLGSAPFSKS